MGYRRAEHIAQSILCDPETTPDITKFNDCQRRWKCDFDNDADVSNQGTQANDPEHWMGEYIPLPHHTNCGTSNELCETLPNLSKIDASGTVPNFSTCSDISNENLCNDSNRCYYDSSEQFCKEYNILNRYSSTNNIKTDFKEGGILNGSMYGDQGGGDGNFRSGLIGRHELTFSIIDTPYKVEEKTTFSGSDYGLDANRNQVIEGFTDSEPNYIKQNSVGQTPNEPTASDSYMKRSKDAQVDLLLSDEDADVSLFYDPTRYRKVDLYDACNLMNETSQTICENKFININNTEELLWSGGTESSRCKYNSMTNECYSIDNPLKAYSKTNVKTNDVGLSSNSVYKNKDYDHLRYSNNTNEKKNIHNKPVSFQNSVASLNKYKGYQGLLPDLPEPIPGETEVDYTTRLQGIATDPILINTNWNLYGGCDIETTPNPDNYPVFLFEDASSATGALEQDLTQNHHQLKPIKDRHKQLIQQYVDSDVGGGMFDEDEYNQLFDYISDAYNYKRPLVLDIYTGVDDAGAPDVAPEAKLREDTNGGVGYASGLQDYEYLKHCGGGGRWNLPFYLDEETTSDAEINQKIDEKNMEDYINFPQCVQTIYNYHYLKTLGDGGTCSTQLHESANNITDMNLFDTYGINTGNYNTTDFHKFKDNDSKGEFYKDDDKGLYNWFFGSDPGHQPDAPPSPDQVVTESIAQLEARRDTYVRALSPFLKSLYWAEVDCTSIAGARCDLHECGQALQQQIAECEGLGEVTRAINDRPSYLAEIARQNQETQGEWDRQWGDEAWRQNMPLLDDGLDDLQTKADAGTLPPSDPITSHNTSHRQDPNNFIGYDYFNYCNEIISKYPSTASQGNNNGCDFQIGSMYSEYTSYPINSEAYYSNYLLVGSGLEQSSNFPLYSGINVSPPPTGDDITFSSNLFGLDESDRKGVYTVEEAITSGNIFADDYANMNFPGDNNIGLRFLHAHTGGLGGWLNWMSGSQTPKIHPEFNLYNCKGSGSDTDDQKCRPSNNKLGYTDKPLYRLWGDTIINYFNYAVGVTDDDTSRVDSMPPTRGELDINTLEHHKFIYTDPFHRMNVRRNMEPIADGSDDANRAKYAFEPIVNNNMLWSTSTDSDKLGFVTPNREDIQESGATVIPSRDGTSVDLLAENHVNIDQSYFIEKYCALLSFPETHPSNNINYDNDWYEELQSLELPVKRKIIDDTNDCSDTECVNYLSGITGTETETDDWLRGLLGTGFDYTNYIMDCLPGFVNHEDKWTLTSDGAGAGAGAGVVSDTDLQCDNTKQILENDIANKLALQYKDNINISYNSLTHEEYPKIDDAVSDKYNNLTRVRVGGYCSGDDCENTVKKPIEVDHRCVSGVGIESDGYCFNSEILTSITETACGTNNDPWHLWRTAAQVSQDDDKTSQVQQNNLKCANTNLKNGSDLTTTTNLYQENKETCEGTSTQRADGAFCKYIPPRNIINLQKSKYQFMLFDENNSGTGTDPTPDPNLTTNNVIWENVILDRMKHICNQDETNGGEADCDDSGVATTELRQFLKDNDIISEDDEEKYSCKWVDEQSYCEDLSPHIKYEGGTAQTPSIARQSVCAYDGSVCSLRNTTRPYFEIGSPNYDASSSQTDCNSYGATGNAYDIQINSDDYDPTLNNNYKPELYQYEDVCTECPDRSGGQRRSPTDPSSCAYKCSEVDPSTIATICGANQRLNNDPTNYQSNQSDCCEDCLPGGQRDPNNPSSCIIPSPIATGVSTGTVVPLDDTYTTVAGGGPAAAVPVSASTLSSCASVVQPAPADRANFCNELAVANGVFFGMTWNNEGTYQGDNYANCCET